MSGVPWTEEEEAALKALVVSSARARVKRFYPWTALREALPARTDHAIRNRGARYAKIAPRGGRAWTPAEDATLRREWSEVAQRTLRAKLPGRSWRAILRRATMVLGLTSIPQGWETFDSAARRTGYCSETLRGILVWANRCAVWVEAITRMFGIIGHVTGGRVVPYDAEAFDYGGARVRLHTTSQSKRGGATVHRWRLVQPDEVDAAVARWCRLETPPTAARRLGVPVATLSQRVRRAGWSGLGCAPRKTVRLPPEVYDAAMRSAPYIERCVPRVQAEQRRAA
jgi:hypothetical protein